MQTYESLANPWGAHLQFSDFSFRYKGADSAVLEGVNWEVEAGSFVVLLGATGAGKTTLLRAAKPELSVAGTLTGTITLDGKPLYSAEGQLACATNAAIGFVAQNPETQIVCDTVWHEMAFGLENLGIPVAQMRRRVAEVAHFFGIEPWFERKTDELSGGQKQLLNLAAILALRPRLLVLDEPMSQLDPVAAKNFLHALFRVNREVGITVVLATHTPVAVLPYATHQAKLFDKHIEMAPLHQKDSAEGIVEVKEAAAQSAKEAAPVGPCTDALPPSRSVKHKNTAPIVSLNEVFMRYARGDDWVLAGANFELHRGCIHAVVGGNGCGKSTLLRLIAGALEPERGRVINACHQAQALVPQDPRALFACETVFEELMEWSTQAHYTENDARAFLEKFSLEAVAHQHPADISGGQQQLLAQAKVLLTRPKLLLLDEPAKGLDLPSKQIVATCLKQAVCEGCSIVMVSHDLSFVAGLADQVTMLFDGQDTGSESTEQFFAGNLFFRPEDDGFCVR